MKVIKNFTSVENVLNILKPDVNNLGRYLYRGQGVDKPLVPSALKKGSKINKLKHLVLDSSYENKRFKKLDPLIKRRYLEFRIINRFIHLADDAGVSLPGDDSLFRTDLYEFRMNHREFKDDEKGEKIDKEINAINEAIGSHWPPINSTCKRASWLSVFALAQHYGLPTRCLDWTANPYIALYFAAIGAIDKKSKGKVIVYKLDLKCEQLNKDKLYVFPIQGSLNPNLSAQKGRLTIHCRENDNDKNQKKGYEKVDGISEALTKYIIPSKYATIILEELKSRYISRDTLFPSLDGIVKSMYERAEYLKR